MRGEWCVGWGVVGYGGVERVGVSVGCVVVVGGGRRGLVACWSRGFWDFVPTVGKWV